MRFAHVLLATIVAFSSVLLVAFLLPPVRVSRTPWSGTPTQARSPTRLTPSRKLPSLLYAVSHALETHAVPFWVDADLYSTGASEATLHMVNRDLEAASQALWKGLAPYGRAVTVVLESHVHGPLRVHHLSTDTHITLHGHDHKAQLSGVLRVEYLTLPTASRLVAHLDAAPIPRTAVLFVDDQWERVHQLARAASPATLVGIVSTATEVDDHMFDQVVRVSEDEDPAVLAARFDADMAFVSAETARYAPVEAVCPVIY